MGLISIPSALEDRSLFPLFLSIIVDFESSSSSSNVVIGSVGPSSTTSIGSVLTLTGVTREGGMNRLCRIGGVDEVEGDAMDSFGIYCIS